MRNDSDVPGEHVNDALNYLASELQTGTEPSKYTLATRETLLGLAEERDKYKKALEEIKDQFCDISNCMLEPQEKLGNIFKTTSEALKND